MFETLEPRALLAAIPPPAGIVSWWTGDGTTEDLVGPNEGMLLAGGSIAAGYVGDGFQFDAVDGNLQAPTVGLPTGSADRTIELWARIGQQPFGTRPFFASYGAPGSQNQAYELGAVFDGRLFVSTWGPAIFGPVLETNRWYHVAATNVGTSFKLYLDGVEVAAGNMAVDTPAGSTFWMGRNTTTSIGDPRRLDGMVDEVSVYDRALVPEEIYAIYSAGRDGKIKGQANGVQISISDATATEGSNTARLIDVPIGAPSSQIDNPKQIVKGTDGDYFVTSATTNTVARYDGVTFQYLGDFVGPGQGGLFDPIGLVFANGDLFVASAGTDAVLRYDGQTGAFIEQFIPSGAFGIDRPTDLIVHNNELYVSAWSGDVHRYDLATGAFIDKFVATGAGGLNDPVGMTFGPDGNFYVSEFAPDGINAVLRFDGSTGDFLNQFVPEGSGGLIRPAGIEFGPDGNLYVVNFDANTVLRYDGNTGAFIDTFVPIGAALNNPTRLLFSGNQLLISSQASDQIMRFEVSPWAVFDVTLNASSDAPVTVNYATANGTALAGSDFAPATGSVTFAPGETTRTILIKAIDDAVAEPAETFTVTLSNAVGAAIADGQGIGTIQDNDPATPVVSLSNSPLIREGLDFEAPFRVTRSGPIDSQVTVNYATADGTAFAGINYAATSGTLTFAPGETEKTILVPIYNDGTTDFVDSFTVNLSNASGASIGTGQAVGNIVDNDPTDWKWTVRASDDGQRVEVYFGNPVAPDAELVFTSPLISFVPLDFTTDDLEDDNDQIFIELPAGTDGPARGIRLDTERGHNELIVKSGRVRIDSVSTGGTLDTIVHAGAELITEQLDQNELMVAAQGRVTLLSAGLTSKLTGLNVAKGGILDLGDNALVVDYDGESPLAAIRASILAGRDGPGFGASWKGPGISSSAVAEANQVEPEAYSIAFAENSALPLGPYTDFRGIPVNDTSVLIAYTRTGDANLDGLVNDDDVTIVNATYAPGVRQPAWALGDFDYNGFVDDDDITLLSAFYDPAGTPVASPPFQVDSTARAAATDLLFLSSDQSSDSVSERQGLDASLAGAKDYAAAVAYLLAEREDPFRPKSLALRSFSH